MGVLLELTSALRMVKLTNACCRPALKINVDRQLELEKHAREIVSLIRAEAR